jgi:hypothetical protein
MTGDSRKSTREAFKELDMLGVIDNKQVASHFGLIWREFGPRCALRCVAALFHRRHTTFLDIAFETSARGKRERAS